MKSIRFARRRPPTSDDKSPLLIFIQAWLPILSVAVAGIYGAWKYFDEKHNKAQEFDKAQLIEAQKPFLTKKMDLFFEAAQTAGNLVAVEVKSDEWNKAKRKIFELRWGPLELAGNPVVRLAMRDVIKQMIAVEKGDAPHESLRNSVECLADELRYSMEESWGNPVKPLGSFVLTLEAPTRTALPSGCYRPEQLKWDVN
ncbi:hypothetical protein [Bradyrhizobium sp. CCBAU 11361]|uniref:hypothetical protein n=1 Tax=Bradyrhizobium sp. CCBAU 11361 TaxID=1630812 RepID=UPI002302390F|nr:hypothetical protein [Bradyrhizobium sp. CCBAU 11361]MDA9488668.1 hypothetical protein [Bradyrhizobium sp. CCBAU 11361]